MKYIQTLLTFWSAVGFGPIFDCDIKTNNHVQNKLNLKYYLHETCIYMCHLVFQGFGVTVRQHRMLCYSSDI